MRPTLPVLHEDDALIVVSKPSGMIVHRGWARDDDDAMRCVRDQIGARVHPVHRLDRGTSGALVFAKSSAAAAVLGEAFEAGDVKKSYVALVRGHLRDAMDLEHPVPRGESGERVPARTVFTPLGSSRLERCSLVRADPVTGRLHQIRRHLKHLSHPIVGDVRYGKGDVNRRFRERWGLHRLALHARVIDLPHGNGRLRIQAPVPSELAQVLHELGLAD